MLMLYKISLILIFVLEDAVAELESFGDFVSSLHNVEYRSLGNIFDLLACHNINLSTCGSYLIMAFP